MSKRLWIVTALIAVMIGVMCFYTGAEADSGTYDGIDWDLTDGVLTLGNGGTQTLMNRSGRSAEGWPWYSQRSSINSVVTKGTLIFQGSLYGMFDYYSNLTSLDLSGWDTSNVTNMYHMFCGCGSLTSLDLSGFNTSKVTDMGYMLSGCTSLTSLDLSGFDTSNVTNMTNMFYSCSSLTSLDVSGFDTSNVTNMTNMFYKCSSLTSLDLSGFNTLNVTSMGQMFQNCSSLTSLDVSGFNTSNVTRMDYMFYNCYNLKSLDVSRFETSKVTDMYWMFTSCIGLTSLDLSGWDTSNVTSMDHMFRYCHSLTSLGLSGWDTSKVTNMMYMFSGCSSLTSLDLSGFNTSHVTRMDYMFYGCNGLRSVVLGENNPFKGKRTSVYADLPIPPPSEDGITYTQKWIREDGTAGPYTPTELRNNYTSAMAGKWVWEEVPTNYTISFVSSEPTAVGDMPQATTLCAQPYTIPQAAYSLFGKVFSFWRDEATGNTYADEGVIPANTYDANANVTLTAYFTDRDTSVIMRDGEFEFSIKGDEKALFDNIPASTSYQVYEQLSKDWVLIYQENSTGLIYSLGESQAIFVNKYQPDITTAQFTGRKLFDGQPALNGQFEFELWEGNVLLQTKPTQDGGFFQFDIIEYDKNDVGTHYYTIKEKVGTDDRLLYDGHEEQVTVEVYTETGTTADEIKVRSRVAYANGFARFENWTKPGELNLTKTVDDLLPNHGDDQFRFRITFKQENSLPLSEALTYIIR